MAKMMMAMVIVGGLASIIGSWFGAAFILLLPGQIHALIAWIAKLLGADIGIETLAHLPYAVYGGLIIVFLLVEPMGLGKRQLRLHHQVTKRLPPNSHRMAARAIYGP